MEFEKKENPNADLRERTVNDIGLFVKNLCLAFSHLSYYPPTHPVPVRHMQEAWAELLQVLDMFPDVLLTMTEGKLLFMGTPVDERNPAVQKVSRHFESLRVRGIKFKRGLTYSEFEAFFIFLCRDTQSVADAGGAEEVLKEKKIKHISLSSTVYKEISEDEAVKRKDETKKSGGGEKAKPQRKISKSFSPLSARIQHKLDTDFKEMRENDRLKLLDYLNNVFVRETKKFEEKCNELQAEIDDIRQIVQNVEEVFEDTNLGFILIDRNQKVCFIEHGNIMPYDLMLNEPLPHEFLKKIEDFDNSAPLKLDNLTIMQVTKDVKKRVKGILFQFE